MATKNDNTEGLQSAYSGLFEACELLQSAREHAQENEAPQEMPAIRALIDAAEGRVQRAVSAFDDVVPHPEDAGPGAPPTGNRADHVQLADQIHNQVGEAAELLESRDLDGADLEALRRAAVHAEGALKGINDAIHSLPSARQPSAAAPVDTISGGDAYDDLMLIMERLDTLVTAISDVEMHGEDRNLVTLCAMARDEIKAAERVAKGGAA